MIWNLLEVTGTAVASLKSWKLLKSEFRLSIDLPSVLLRLYTASGDIRTNGDKYVYEIQLSGITNSSFPECSEANICQVKTNERRFRRIGFAEKAKYYVEGKYLLASCNCLIFI